ncbi:hypothetical protein GH5_01851 [Leishmania sp. Ghana 2012 LV757]|uniref:hypothetical protein n=1 Tax=Leishmania sp. Ghana 2012 LV757 TaxID=2803181 RepID=UPI001B524D5E|nr:hypothetical protein GH5_01851 [Leishmania sp. Ghana 2012 LV757]
MASSSSSLSSAPCSSCVLGTLTDSLRLAIEQGGQGGVTAYLASELPCNPQGSKNGGKGPLGDICASVEAPGTYAVFEDARTCCRWTVELVSANAAGNGYTDTWWMDPEHLAAVGAMEAADAASSAPHQQGKCVGRGCASRITAMRYYMKPGTWRETFLLRESETATPSRAAAEVPHSTRVSTREVASSDPRRSITGTYTHEQATPFVPITAASVVAATATSEASSSSVASSPLHGLSLHQLVEQHSALARRLVQVLAPQRQPIPHVIRELCTAIVTSPTSGVNARVCILPSADGPNAAPMQYTECDVAAAIEQLTSSHPRQPRLRELRSEGYLLMNVSDFADGKTRHKAVNRAYPALAQHWPASAQQMDAIERYADRDVVLDTRMRHPVLSEERPDKKHRQKRGRSLSSTASCASGTDEDEHSARASCSSSTLASPPLGAAASPAKTATTPRRFFHSLREYPKSLEHGNLHAWARGTAAQQARDCLQAATALIQRSASAANASSDAATLGPPPITNEEDVAVLRCQYDALATAESVLEKQLCAYSDTVQDLHGWYREELCTQHFRCELEAWLRTQEETRAALTDLYVQVHAVRYSLQRDLSDYLHLHALGVL